jgi:hypothetical protein
MIRPDLPSVQTPVGRSAHVREEDEVQLGGLGVRRSISKDMTPPVPEYKPN